MQRRLLFILFAIALHVALLRATLHASVAFRESHWQTIYARLEAHQPLQKASVSSVVAPVGTHPLVSLKPKQKPHELKPDTPAAIAEAPAAHREESAAPPRPTSPPAGPVVGLALPQPAVMQGHHRLWDFAQGSPVPDQQALMQQQRQYAMQSAMQAARAAAREKFETQFMTALASVPLHSPCRVIMPAAQAIRFHCENEADSNAIAAMVKQAGEAPAISNNAASLVIDLAPDASGGTQAVSHHADAASLQEMN